MLAEKALVIVLLGKIGFALGRHSFKPSSRYNADPPDVGCRKPRSSIAPAV
jgi:hypothetical protein